MYLKFFFSSSPEPVYINGTCKHLNSQLMEIFKEKLFQKIQSCDYVVSIKFELSVKYLYISIDRYIDIYMDIYRYIILTQRCFCSFY